MKVFFDNLARVVPINSRYGSLHKLSEDAIGQAKYISGAIKKNSDINLTRALKISNALGLSLDELARPGCSVNAYTPTIDPFINCFRISQGHVNDFAGIIEFADLYLPPNEGDNTLLVHKIGRNSLAANTLNTCDVGVAQAALDSSGNSSLDDRLKASYAAAAGGLLVLGVETLNEKISVPPFAIRMRFKRLLLHVTTNKQETLVLNYSTQIGPTETQ
ncbi:MAG: hypothetical protein ABJL99_09820 [Aliishimia sp.]